MSNVSPARSGFIACPTVRQAPAHDRPSEPSSPSTDTYYGVPGSSSGPQPYFDSSTANGWASESRSLGYTPPEVLDGYRGMQVWIDHGSGLVSRYAHLGSIEPGIVEGATVTRGQVIGTVGNSGTPSSVSSDTAEVHLHLELWLGDNYVGRFMRPIETREWLERILR